MKIASVGDISIDHYTNIDVKKPGGIAFNFAVHVTHEKEHASLVTVIGSDIGGKKLKKLLKKCKFNISYLSHLHGKTAKQKIIIESNGEKTFVGYNAGVLKHWKLNEKTLDFIATYDAIFVPLSDGMEHVFHNIASLKTKAVKVTDFSKDYEFADFDKKNNIITKYAKYFDINFIGGSENQISLITQLSKQHPEKIFVLTLGQKGSIGFSNGKSFIQSAKKVEKIVDTTGCGDAFQATFLTTYLKTKNISLALKHATNEATKVLQHIGSTTYAL